MRVLIFGDDKDKLKSLVKSIGFTIVDKNPDFIISYGGDGTFIRSEFEFPGIPKIILRNSQVCKICQQNQQKISNDEILRKVKKNKFVIKDFWKLVATVENKKLFALNEIVVHNKNPQHCIRYKVFIDNKEVGGEIIGDGIVVATPFGSTAYYKSITDSFFEVGIGLAFNNSTEQSDHMILKENRKIKLVVTRGPAIVYADNQFDILEISKGDEVYIQKSSQIAKMVSVEG